MNTKTMKTIVAVLLPAIVATWGVAGELSFRMQQISDRLGVGYAVRLLDMNADKQPDILVVDTDRIIWFENPTWKMHTLIHNQTRKDNVCFAPYDIDGDGKVDFALGADWLHSTSRGGTLQWITRGKKADGPWDVLPIGEEPTIHRIRWADLDGDGRKELIVVPLFGRGTKGPHYADRGVRILSYKVPKDPRSRTWKAEVINDELHVAHNFWPTDLDRDGKTDLLVASYEGVSLLTRDAGGKWSRVLIGTGNQKTSPKRGASEIKHGRLAKGRDYIATIEPWHGHQVVVYTPPPGKPADVAQKMWTRHVLDERLKWGHAVWCANLDDDEDEELIIGVRDNKSNEDRCGLRIFDPAAGDPKKWKRHLVDPGGVAIEDLAAADLNGDGRIDIVAVGRATKNVRIYWNQTK